LIASEETGEACEKL